MNADGSNVRRLTNLSGLDCTINEFQKGELESPAFSPDGTRIAFTSFQFKPGLSTYGPHVTLQSCYEDLQIYVMNADGSHMTSLINGPGMSPAFSPDGTRIAYVPTERRGGKGIYIMNADGSNVTRLASDGDSPAFSPDGTRIAFESSRDRQGGNVYMMNVDGSNVSRLTEGLFDGHPTFSRDGTRIAFQSNRDRVPRGSQIYVMNADGSNVTRLTNDGYLPTFGP
jgi:TolB protein